MKSYYSSYQLSIFREFNPLFQTNMTSIAESHSPKHQRSPNSSSGISGRRRSTERETTSNMQQNVSTGTSSGSRSSPKILTHQMSSGALTAALGRSSRDRDITDLVPSSPECSYAACFCEENVWKLADHVRQCSPPELSKTYVVFVSNRKQVVPLWRQRAGRDEEKLVIWDYHVIFVYKSDERRCLVFDLDSDLPFPTFFHKYVTETFRTDNILNQEYHRFFRVVPAAQFLQKFASDRRHMKKSDGSWMKPPPDYPCISTAEATHNLDEFISMESSSSGNGEVMSLIDFVKRFHRN